MNTVMLEEAQTLMGEAEALRLEMLEIEYLYGEDPEQEALFTAKQEEFEEAFTIAQQAVMLAASTEEDP